MTTDPKSNLPAQQAPTQNKLAVKRKDIADEVLVKINELVSCEQLQLPKDYSVANAMKGALLYLSECVDKNNKPVLEVCTRESIADSLFKMAVDGLSVHKGQGSFIAYGTKLSWQREYDGNIAIALRGGIVTGIPNAHIIYKGDAFEYTTDIKTGLTVITKHEPKFENISKNNINGAFCYVPLSNGTYHVEIMTMEMIRDAWNQSPLKGNSPAHRNFPDQMCKKTVISRALKLFNSSADDSYLSDNNDAQEPIVISSKIATDNNATEDFAFEEMKEEKQKPVETPAVKPAPTKVEPPIQSEKQEQGDAPFYNPSLFDEQLQNQNKK